MSENGLPTTVLIDSSFLIALNSIGDKNYEKAATIARLNISKQLVVDIVLAEIAFMLRLRVGQSAVLNLLDVLTRSSSVQLEPVSKADLIRAREIMAEYTTADLDLADCCIMAIAERLNITHICTFDHRDFGMVKPKHCEYFTLLPLMME